MLIDRGAKIKRISVPLMKYCLPFYFTVVPNQPDFKENEDLLEYIERIRTDNFGLNVKRRVMLGNFLLSSKHE